MLPSISVILAALFLTPALPNGIQLVEVPTQGNSVEIVAGYGSAGLTGFATTSAARAVTLTAYSVGGDAEFFSEFERTGIRIKIPQWALSMFTAQLPGLFQEVPQELAAQKQGDGDFREKVEEEIRNALVGTHQQTAEYATDRAFVLFPGPISDDFRTSLASIPNRPSRTEAEMIVNRLPAERTLRFKSDLETGAVIFASPTPPIYYKEWYSILLLDRVIHRALLKISSELLLSVHPYYYRFEVPVPAGQFPEPVEENLLQEIQRLQFTRSEPAVLEAARQDARTYLESPEVKEWFTSLGIPERREEGLAWIQGMSADDVRVAARDLLVMNRVIATWSPKAKQTAVEVEELAKAGGDPPAAASRPSLTTGVALPIIPFPPHTHENPTLSLPERLSSGVFLVASNTNGVFVSGGTLTRYEREPGPDILKTLQENQPDRILVLAKPDSIDRARQFWSSFKGGGSIGVPRGDISTGDLPALVIIKTLMDRKVIEAGWWRDVELKISAGEGSTLAIAAPAEKRALIMDWIKQLGVVMPTEAEMVWAREVAGHNLGKLQADLQALTWERDPKGTVQDLQTVSAGHVQDVARIYF